MRLRAIDAEKTERRVTILKHFCVITNQDKDENYELAQYIADYLDARGHICDILPNEPLIREGVCHYTDVYQIAADMECAIVLGGDGTMIQAAIDLVHRDIPILGVNIGTVGFLTEVERQNLNGALDKLLAGQYSIESRIMLEAVQRGQKETEIFSCYALNDIVVSKRGGGRLITVKVYINGELADIYRADGLIVSTPTGSTGYNLSAGGPVLVPHAHATVITPICAHSLNKRSLVLDAGDNIELEIGQTKEAQQDLAVLVADGRNAGELVTGNRICITVPSCMTQLVKLSDIGFYKRMRDKLNGFDRAVCVEDTDCF